ncbi:MAG TPA: phage tail sheath subtilisin-like domain-containing protein [Myxococcota bacterium]|nr:phage tail sheath subtilisin-like domain-containing protein [Myxococcota bacterium]HNB59188.1 phage tail sheath subtilisin-like domain-containing protein [Phycisphaerales bacterium]
MINEIPLSLIPGNYVSIDGSQAIQGLSSQRARVLLFGTKLSGGTATALVPVKITREDQGDDLFGVGTPLAEMCRLFRKHNKISELTVIPQAEAGGGAKASNTVTFTGTATASGSLYIYVGGRRFVVPVAEGDTNEDVAAATEDVINADPRAYVDALVDGVNADELDLTSKWKGASANYLSVEFNYYSDEAFPPGITASATAFASGATDPTLSAAIAVMGDTQYHTVLMPWTDTTNLNALKTTMEARWGATARNEGLTIAAYRETYSNTQSLGNGRNSKTEVIFGTAKAPTPPWEYSAVFAAVEAAITDPAAPRFGLALPDVLPPKLESNRFTETERGLLLADGISTVRVGAGGVVYTESVLTTWQVNELDIEDDSFQWIETLRCASYFRQDMLVFLGSRFKDHKVADDETPIGPGQKVATPALVRAAVLGRYALYERQAICEGGAEFADSLVVERHANDPGRMDILSYPDFVNQLRNIAVRESFIV